MPARTGKCTNFGGCNKADSGEVITIPDGAEFVCPDCERALVAVGGGRGKSGGPSSGKLKLILFGLLGVGVLGALLTWLFIGGSPNIQNLTVEPAQIDAGQTATLKWSVEHATDVSIDPGLGGVQPEDTFPVSPRGTTTYTLTAKSGSRLVTKSVILQVNPSQQPAPIPGPGPTPIPGPGPGPGPIAPVSGRPVILSFSATPSVVQVGQTLVFQWSTSNARSVSFPGARPPKNNLPPSGSLSITPRAPGNFPVSLMAMGQRTSVRKTIVIRVTNGGFPTPGPSQIPGPGHGQSQRPGPGPRNQGQRNFGPGNSVPNQQEPNPGPGPIPLPPGYVARPPANPSSNQDQDQEQEQEPSAPAQGVLIWEGDVQGTQLVTIQAGMASPGQLISGRLPGVQVILQPQNEKKVGIASAPSPDNHYQRLVLRVFGHGHTRVVVNWSTP